MDFSDESFDIIWTEGAVFPVGFNRALKEWKRFLKPGGVLAAHDSTGSLKEKLKLVEKNGYRLIEHFTLDNNEWIDLYYSPLLDELKKLKDRVSNRPKDLKAISREEKEIINTIRNPAGLSSTFFILQKLY
jgi:SAM-dependent methyltransferase